MENGFNIRIILTDGTMFMCVIFDKNNKMERITDMNKIKKELSEDGNLICFQTTCMNGHFLSSNILDYKIL